jgi:hypothetical protein
VSESFIGGRTRKIGVKREDAFYWQRADSLFYIAGSLYIEANIQVRYKLPHCK